MRWPISLIELMSSRPAIARSTRAIAIGMVVGWIYYDQIFAWISAPFTDAIAQARGEGRTITLALTGVADPFVLQLQIAAVTGLVLSSPIWLYQLWRFVTPGLHKHERRWAVGFAAVATPLFAAGVWLAYTVLPYGLTLLLGFTPDGVENIISVDRYLSFFIRTVIVFGVGFLIPLLLVLLNFAGVLPGRRLLGWWRWIVIIVILFAAYRFVLRLLGRLLVPRVGEEAVSSRVVRSRTMVSPWGFPRVRTSSAR